MVLTQRHTVSAYGRGSPSDACSFFPKGGKLGGLRPALGVGVLVEGCLALGLLWPARPCAACVCGGGVGGGYTLNTCTAGLEPWCYGRPGWGHPAGLCVPQGGSSSLQASLESCEAVRT